MTLSLNMTRVENCWEIREWLVVEGEVGTRGGNECGGDVCPREATQLCLLAEKER